MFSSSVNEYFLYMPYRYEKMKNAASPFNTMEQNLFRCTLLPLTNNSSKIRIVERSRERHPQHIPWQASFGALFSSLVIHSAQQEFDTSRTHQYIREVAVKRRFVHIRA